MADTPEEQAAFENELKDELIAKLADKGIKADRHYSVPKLEEMLGNTALEVPVEEAGPEPDPLPPVEVPEIVTAAPAEAPAPSAGSVKVRITKMGDGKVHTGRGADTFKWNDEPSFPLDVAEALEARGFAEIQ